MAIGKTCSSNLIPPTLGQRSGNLDINKIVVESKHQLKLANNSSNETFTEVKHSVIDLEKLQGVNYLSMILILWLAQLLKILIKLLKKISHAKIFCMQ